jgi:hypothetical protein
VRLWIVLFGIIALSLPASAQDRDTKVRNDRKTFAASTDWIYNDLAAGLRAARLSGKPLLVVFRCIPCEACQEFDDEVARRDPVIRDLLDQFVCVRLVQANAIDLTEFQHDFDLSFTAYFLNPDGTLYGRFGTRSERPEPEDIALEGLRAAMEGALRMHRDYPAIKPALAGKQARSTRYKTPRDYPSLAGKYGTTLDYEGKVAQSCMHCHQVREAERLVVRSAGGPIPDEVLFPYPDPSVLGLKLDPKARATVERVAPGTSAERAGLRPGDAIETLAGQPLLSIADVQWVLQNTPSAAGQIDARVRRGDENQNLTLGLPEGWRRGNISWRATTWDLRRMGLGGMKLADLDDARRAELKLPRDAMALKAEYVGEYGDHAVAKRAGFRNGDILVAFDGQNRRMSESLLLAYALQRKRPGDVVAVTVLRDGARMTLKFAIQ